MRKSNDYEMMDQIQVYYQAPEAFKMAIEKHSEYIKSETLAVSVTEGLDKAYEVHQLNGHEVGVYLEKN